MKTCPRLRPIDERLTEVRRAMAAGEFIQPHRQTVNCVRCGKPAKAWCGHVHLGGETLTAGWCVSSEDADVHPAQAGTLESPACEGDWTEAMGAEVDPW